MSQIDDLPPLRDVISRHGLTPRKSLGQNFLLDLNLTMRIALAAGDLKGKHVIEVGPGPGGLTRALLAAGAERVSGIERDSRCIAALQEVSSRYPGKLEIIEADALTIDLEDLASGPFQVVANLPYNVGTQLLVNWISQPDWPPKFESLTLMFQKEVAQRIIASAGDSHYGRLSVLCGWRSHADRLFDVSASAFTPPPKVTSSVVQLVPRAYRNDIAPEQIERVTRHAFGQRRKMLRAALKPLGGADLLNSVHINPEARAETLTVDQFLDLAAAI